MLNRLFRIMAWVCIVAHLNLVVPPYHVAYAMDFEGPMTIEQGGDVVPIKTKSVNAKLINAQFEEFAEKEQRANPHSPSFNLENPWDGTNAIQSFIKSIPFILLASVLEGGDPIIYFLTSFASIVLFDKFVAPQASRVINASRAVVASPSEGVTKVFWAFAYLLTCVEANPTVNGGSRRPVLRDGSDVIRYNNETAPFLLGVDNPDQVYLTTLHHSVYLERDSYNRTYFRALEKNITDSLINDIIKSAYNITIKNTFERGLEFIVTAKNLKAWLTNLSFFVPSNLLLEQIFNFYNNTNYEGDPLFAVRFFNLVSEDYPSAPTFHHHSQTINVGTLLGGIFGGGGGLVLLIIVCPILSFKGYYYLFPEPTDQEKAEKITQTLNSQDETALNYDVLSEHLSDIEDREIRQNAAWNVIQKYKELIGKDKESSLTEDLFKLCSYMGKTHQHYKEAIELQVDIFHNRTNAKLEDRLRQLPFGVASSERDQAIVWRYIQKYQEELEAQDPRAVFMMYGLVEDREENASDGDELLEEVVVHTPEVVAPREDLGSNDSNDIELKELSDSISVEEETFEEQDAKVSEVPNVLSAYIAPIKEILDQEGEATSASTSTTDPWWQRAHEKKEPKKEEKPSRYGQAIAKQAHYLQEILAQEPGTATCTGSDLFLTLMKKEFENVNMKDKRRYDVMVQLIINSNLSPELRLKLCDEILEEQDKRRQDIDMQLKLKPEITSEIRLKLGALTGNEPQYKRAIIEKAELIHADKKLTPEDRFKNTMNVLLLLPHDENAKALMQPLREDYWGFVVEETLPKAVINPQDEEQLKEFMSYAQERKKEKQKLSAM